MAGSKSDYAEAIVLNMFLGGTSYTPPATLYLALSTAAYADSATGAAMTEVSTSSTGYVRLAVTNNSTNWPAATGSNPTTKGNGAAFTFATATGSWGTILSAYISDNATVGSGNLIYGGDLTTSKTIASGDTATFASSSITATED